MRWFVHLRAGSRATRQTQKLLLQEHHRHSSSALHVPKTVVPVSHDRELVAAVVGGVAAAAVWEP